jgi:phage FluMu protein Com
MEIRCSKCGHLGEAAEVRPLPSGVGLVCGACGHVNELALGGGPAEAAEPEPEVTPQAKPSARTERSPLMERLIPEPGDGLRCRKCATLVEADTVYCPRCGLDLEEGSRLGPGEAPWEQPPEGKEAAFDQARLLWGAASERREPRAIADFVDFALEEGLLDYGLRELQHYLVDHPGDEAALEGLERLAKRLQTTVDLARSRAEAQADSFNEDVKRFRARLLIGALAFWVVILLLLSLTFWDRF